MIPPPLPQRPGQRSGPLPFHTIWLGGSPPLRVLDNLCHLLHLSSADPGGCPPLLWLDRSAW
ncbi:MAG: hypothetical protein ACKO50_02710, partial [Cyanobium sp.]